MTVFLNDQFVREEEARISIHDRGFLYGDGLFETIRAYNYEPFLWDEHMNRFAAGASFLRIVPPLGADKMKAVVAELLRRNHLSEAILRIALSRGVGQRGYSPENAGPPTFVIATFEIPSNPPVEWKVITSSIRLMTNDPLAPIKHANKLRQVIARAEADDAGANEALMLNENGEAVEGTTTNLFWIENGTVCTPPLDGILPGTTRDYLLKLARRLGIATREANVTPPALLNTEGVFVTASGIEIVEVSEIDGKKIRRSPLVDTLKRNYRTALAA